MCTRVSQRGVGGHRCRVHKAAGGSGRLCASSAAAGQRCYNTSRLPQQRRYITTACPLLTLASNPLTSDSSTLPAPSSASRMLPRYMSTLAPVRARYAPGLMSSAGVGWMKGYVSWEFLGASRAVGERWKRCAVSAAAWGCWWGLLLAGRAVAAVVSRAASCCAATVRDCEASSQQASGTHPARSWRSTRCCRCRRRRRTPPLSASAAPPRSWPRRPAGAGGSTRCGAALPRGLVRCCTAAAAVRRAHRCAADRRARSPHLDADVEPRGGRPQVHHLGERLRHGCGGLLLRVGPGSWV